MGEKRGLRRQAREGALQALFMCDFLNSWNEETADYVFDHFAISRLCRAYAETVAHGVIKNLARIDGRITGASEHWSISRMSRVDRVILRIAVLEMYYLDDVPVSVAIDEAVEIAKRFGADESPMFINGVLDRAALSLKREIEVEKIAPKVEEVTAPAILIAEASQDAEKKVP